MTVNWFALISVRKFIYYVILVFLLYIFVISGINKETFTLTFGFTGQTENSCKVSIVQLQLCLFPVLKCFKQVQYFLHNPQCFGDKLKILVSITDTLGGKKIIVNQKPIY